MNTNDDLTRVAASLAIGDSLPALVDHWLNEATSSCSSAEAASLRSVAGRIKHAFCDIVITEVTPLLIKSYLQARLDEGLARRTVANRLKAMRRIMAYACRLGIRPDNPAIGVVMPDGKGETIHIESLRRQQVRRRGVADSERNPRPGPIGTVGGPTASVVEPMQPNSRPMDQPKPALAQPNARVSSPWQEVRLGSPWMQGGAAPEH